MSLDPLLRAEFAIQIHAFSAMAAFVIGLIQFAGPKGTTVHRLLGWSWVGSMLAVAISSFWIHEIKLVGQWSPIHLLSIYTLITLPVLILAARRKNITAHRRSAIGVFVGALVIAGAFTLLPGRIMHDVVF